MVLNPDFLEMAGNEIFPKVEFGDVFPRMRLEDTLKPLSTKTGIKLFDLYKAHVESPGKKDSWTENVRDAPHLSPYFDSNVKGRSFLQCLEVLHPEKKIPLDYLVMEEKIREGVDVLAVFAVPPPDDPFWKKIDVGKLGATKFDYLQIKGAFLVLSDLNDPYNTDKKEAIEITAPLFANPQKDVGFLSERQGDSEAERFNVMTNSKSVLIKDREPIDVDFYTREFARSQELLDLVLKLRVATPQGETQMDFLGSVWAHIMIGAGLQSLMTKNLIRNEADVKKFEELFTAACGTFFFPNFLIT